MDDPFADLLGPPRASSSSTPPRESAPLITDTPPPSAAAPKAPDIVTSQPGVVSPALAVMLKEDVRDYVSEAVGVAVNDAMTKVIGSMRGVLEQLGTRMQSVEGEMRELASTVKTLSIEDVNATLNARFAHVDDAIKDVGRSVQAMRDRAELADATSELAKLTAESRKRCEECVGDARPAAASQPSAPAPAPAPVPRAPSPSPSARSSQHDVPVAAYKGPPEPAPALAPVPHSAPPGHAPYAPPYALPPGTQTYSAPPAPAPFSAPPQAASQAPPQQQQQQPYGVLPQYGPPLPPMQSQGSQPLPPYYGGAAPPPTQAPYGGYTSQAAPPPMQQRSSFAPAAPPPPQLHQHQPPRCASRRVLTFSVPADCDWSVRSGEGSSRMTAPPPPPPRPQSHAGLRAANCARNTARRRERTRSRRRVRLRHRTPRAVCADAGGVRARRYNAAPMGPPPPGRVPPSRVEGTAQMSTQQVVQDLCQMGFEKHRIEAVMAQMIRAGQNIDLNVIVDRLMNGAGR